MIFVYIFVGLVVALLVAAALLPKVYNVEKTAIINRSIPEVMKKVSDLNEYAVWNPWQKSEPGSSRVITGSPGTPGHRYAWEGKKIGVGNLTLSSIDDKHIHFDLQILKPWKSKARDNWLFEPWGDGDTKVTWQNSGELPWPIARLMGPMISKNLDHQFGAGLNNLKQLCES